MYRFVLKRISVSEFFSRQSGPAKYCRFVLSTRHKQLGLKMNTMRVSTAVIALGVVLFAIPLPGTYILGVGVALFGAFLRWFGV